MDMDERMLRFVAKYYRRAAFDAGEAFAKFRVIAGIPGNVGASAGHGDGRIMRRLRTLAAAVVSAAACAAVLIAVHRARWTEYRAFETAMSFVLPDSTVAVLAPGAELRMQPNRDRRFVEMSGNVYFSVRHDESVPFRIKAGDFGFVRVLGTRFQVKADSAKVSVDVVSGKVLFAEYGDRNGDGGLMLGPGMSGVLSCESQNPELMDGGRPNPAIWATGEFVYDRTPLSDVIEELSDYYGVSLSVVSDGEWKDRCLTARLSAESLEEILPVVEAAMDVEIR